MPTIQRPRARKRAMPKNPLRKHRPEGRPKNPRLVALAKLEDQVEVLRAVVSTAALELDLERAEGLAEGRPPVDVDAGIAPSCERLAVAIRGMGEVQGILLASTFREIRRAGLV